MNVKELFLNAREYGTDVLGWLGRKSGLVKEQSLSETYAGRQFGMWIEGFTAENMRWINRLYKKLLKADPAIRTNEPGIQGLLDKCRERGLCSQNLYDALKQYGDRENGLPLVLNLEPVD